MGVNGSDVLATVCLAMSVGLYEKKSNTAGGTMVEFAKRALLSPTNGVNLYKSAIH